MVTARVREATKADAPALATLHVAQRPGSNMPAELVAEIMDDPNEAFSISDDATAGCRISAIPDNVRRQLRVSWLYPRAEFAAPGNFRKVADVLGEALRIAARKWPDKLGWRIWADFEDGRDQNGVPDQGEALCRFWQANAFPVARVDPPNAEHGNWTISSLLSEAVALVTVPAARGGGR